MQPIGLLDIAHYIISCSMLKDDFQQFEDQKDFSHRHPVASWLGSMMLCFAEDILGNICIGESPLIPFTKSAEVLWATAVWYTLNFCPHDWAYDLCASRPAALIIWTMKEFDRARRIKEAVTFANINYPNSCIAIFITANLKGSGAAHMQLFERLFAGEWMPSQIDTLRPSIATKVTAFSVFFYMMHNKGLLPVSEEMLFYTVAFCLIVIRAFILQDNYYLLQKAEDIFCFIFFGGVIDWYYQANVKQVTRRKSTLANVN